MRKAIISTILIAMLFIPSIINAIETAPRISDREIIEGLADIRGDIKRLEEGQNTLRSEIKQVREDMNSQFNRITAVFTALVVAVIGFAIWDRRTMVRPFETRVKKIEDDIAEDRSKLHTLIEALKSLSKTDEKVAEILKKFNLL